MRLLYSVAFAVLMGGLSACTRPQATSEAAPSAAAQAPAEVLPVAVDVPTFVGYTIEEVRSRLGTPRESQLEPTVAAPKQRRGKSLRVADEGWTNTFETNGVTLAVTFNARTRRVRDIVLIGDNEAELMQRGNLILTAPAYIVLPVLNPIKTTELLGVRVIGRR
ncbi:hypothetical protein ACW9KT_07130 [Hymenobacter sp. HD11105]